MLCGLQRSCLRPSTKEDAHLPAKWGKATKGCGCEKAATLMTSESLSSLPDGPDDEAEARSKLL